MQPVCLLDSPPFADTIKRRLDVDLVPVDRGVRHA